MNPFEMRTPPPGGLARLRERMEAPPSRAWVFVAATATAGLALALALWPPKQPELAVALRAELSAKGVQVENGAVRQVAPDVYLVLAGR